MRKEIIIAILVGLGLGLIITYGFYNAKLATTADNMTSKTEIDSVATTSATEANGDALIVTNPEDELVTSEQSLAVIGSTSPGNFLVLFIDDEATIIETESDGKFSTTATLKIGPHVLTLHSVDENGLTVTETRTVIIQPAPTADPIDTETASESAQLSPTPTKAGTKATASPTPTKKPSATPTPKKP